jgi:ATP-dependent RNA circularization protein (DNA/RNA ligase family)
MSRLVKYPKTPHLPWSPGLQNDDRLMPDTECFHGKWIVVTEKMDGENTTMYNDAIHARSLDGRHHASRDWVKGLHGSIKHLIPDGWRICGENLYAKHSIHYEDLKSYFMVFSIWEYDRCLNWDETMEYSEDFGLKTVPVLYTGPWEDWVRIRTLTDALTIEDGREGYVVRLYDSFGYNEFDRSVAKYVRKGHVQTDEHWMTQAVVPNKLKER